MQQRPLDPPCILLVDEDTARAAAITTALRADGARVLAARTADAARAAIDLHRPSAVVVALDGQASWGWDVVRAAHAHGCAPVVAIERSGSAAVRRAALGGGADEVVTAPIEPAELAARVWALLRLVANLHGNGHLLRYNGLVLDPGACEVRVDGRAVALTTRQQAILRALLEAKGSALSRVQLVNRIASLDNEPPSERAIDLHVSRLRKRLGDGEPPRFIEAVYGLGYRLARSSDTGRVGLAGREGDVLDALPEPMLVVDRGLVVRYANLAAERLLGAPRATLAGRPCSAVLGCAGEDGQPLDGPRCYGRAVLGGDSVLRAVPVRLAALDPSPATLSYARVLAGGDDALIAISVRRDTGRT